MINFWEQVFQRIGSYNLDVDSMRQATNEASTFLCKKKIHSEVVIQRCPPIHSEVAPTWCVCSSLCYCEKPVMQCVLCECVRER